MIDADTDGELWWER